MVTGCLHVLNDESTFGCRLSSPNPVQSGKGEKGHLKARRLGSSLTTLTLTAVRSVTNWWLCELPILPTHTIWPKPPCHTCLPYPPTRVPYYTAAFASTHTASFCPSPSTHPLFRMVKGTSKQRTVASKSPLSLRIRVARISWRGTSGTDLQQFHRGRVVCPISWLWDRDP